MINDICDAYTYLEFCKSFNAYKKMRLSSTAYTFNTEKDIQADWELILEIYEKLSEFMSDESITQAQKAVMELY